MGNDIISQVYCDTQATSQVAVPGEAHMDVMDCRPLRKVLAEDIRTKLATDPMAASSLELVRVSGMPAVWSH
eukprot:11983721-Heterocapsa_arctica.AAC.1